MHRFIPAVAAATAGARIAEVPVRHHARRFGASKYGLSRVGKVVADLLVIKMIRSFRDRPLVMFVAGALLSGGVAMILAGAVALCVVAPLGVPAASCGEDSLVLHSTGLLLLGLSFYLLMLGLIAEALLRQTFSSRRHLPPVIRERAFP
jgi:hypothetical protein